MNPETNVREGKGRNGIKIIGINHTLTALSNVWGGRKEENNNSNVQYKCAMNSRQMKVTVVQEMWTKRLFCVIFALSSLRLIFRTPFTLCIDYNMYLLRITFHH